MGRQTAFSYTDFGHQRPSFVVVSTGQLSWVTEYPFMTFDSGLVAKLGESLCCGHTPDNSGF